MKNSLWYILIALAILQTSCEKTIDVDLKNAAPRIVIEAVLEQGKNDFTVLISTTSDYFTNEGYSTIDNAEVTLTNSAGDSVIVPFVESGKYKIKLNALEGVQYYLSVNANGINYQATSYLPNSITLDSTELEFRKSTPQADEGYAVFLRFNDPSSNSNYYRVLHAVDGRYAKEGDDLQIVDDRLFNGGNARLPIFGKTFEQGDSLKIVLIHFDEAAYEYFNSLSDIIGSGGGPAGGTAAPGNPNTNWNNDALGYFIAQNSDTLALLIP